MALPIYLAMTQGEFLHCPQLPEHIAWMESSFSPSGAGLSQLPHTLPPNSLLMVTDQYPPQNHDSGIIVEQLKKAAEDFSLCGVVLDFQRPYCEELSMIADAICDTLPCPVALTPTYRKDQAAVFLPPIPEYQSAKAYLAPYGGQEIWLETELRGLKMTVTADGCTSEPLESALQGNIFEDSLCRCHYTIDVVEDRAIFSMQRTENDLQALLSDAETMGVTKALGLYQQQVLFVHDGA